MKKDGFCKFNLKGEFVEVNQDFCNIVGGSPKDYEGKSYLAFLSADDIQRVTHLLEKKPEHRPLRDISISRFTGLNGQPLTLYWEYLFSPSQQETYAVVKDVTHNLEVVENLILEQDREKERIMHSLNSKQVALSELAGGVSHEINNPLCSLTMHLEVLEMKLEGQENVKKHLHASRVSVDRIIKVVKSLGTFARAHSENIPLGEIEIKEFVLNNLRFNRYKLEEEGISVEIDLEDCTLFCKESLVSPILINLIDNAREALEGVEDPQIKVSGKVQEDTYEIVIANNGPVIDESIRSKIMDPFFTTKAFGKHSGMGLSVAHGAARKLRGSLSLLEECKTTAFKLIIPIFEET